MRNRIQSLLTRSKKEASQPAPLSYSPGSERRSAERELADYPAIVRVVDAEGSIGTPMSARVVSTSDGGLQLRMDFILPCSPVQIRFAEKVFFGDVRYCLSNGDELRIGVRLSNSQKASLP